MDTIPNVHIPEYTQPRMAAISNRHTPKWARSRMGTIPNRLLHLYTSLNVANCFVRTFIPRQ